MAAEKLIQESRDVINQLSAYNEGVEPLTLKQFGHLLTRAQDLTAQFDAAIDSTSRSQDTLLNMRDRLEKVVATGSFDMDKIDEISGNRYGMFGGSAPSTREGVHVEDFNFSSNDLS